MAKGGCVHFVVHDECQYFYQNKINRTMSLVTIVYFPPSRPCSTVQQKQRCRDDAVLVQLRCFTNINA